MVKRDKKTMDMFSDYTPATMVSATFNADQIRGENFSVKLSHGIAAAMSDCPRSRDEILNDMRSYLGPESAGNVSVNILNAWASETRADQQPNPTRLMALLDSTKDMRLLNLFAEPNGWAVIDKKYLPAIREAMIADEIERKEKELDLLEQSRKKARHGWKGSRS